MHVRGGTAQHRTTWWAAAGGRERVPVQAAWCNALGFCPLRVSVVPSFPGRSRARARGHMAGMVVRGAVRTEGRWAGWAGWLGGLAGPDHVGSPHGLVPKT